LVSPKTIAAILRGGLEKAAEVGCAIIGGHSIRNPEPIYGLAVTGVVDLRNILANENARPGDVLVLSKPLGTGIATTAIKRRLADLRVASLVQKVFLADAQTSGGLLLCVAEATLPKVLRVLKKAQTSCAAVIGRITRRRPTLICTTK